MSFHGSYKEYAINTSHRKEQLGGVLSKQSQSVELRKSIVRIRMTSRIFLKTVRNLNLELSALRKLPLETESQIRLR